MKSEMNLGNLILRLQTSSSNSCDSGYLDYFLRGKEIGLGNKQKLLDSKDFIDWFSDIFTPMLRMDNAKLKKEDELKLIQHFPEAEKLLSDLDRIEPKDEYFVYLVIFLMGVIIGLLL